MYLLTQKLHMLWNLKRYSMRPFKKNLYWKFPIFDHQPHVFLTAPVQQALVGCSCILNLKYLHSLWISIHGSFHLVEIESVYCSFFQDGLDISIKFWNSDQKRYLDTPLLIASFICKFPDMVWSWNLHLGYLLSNKVGQWWVEQSWSLPSVGVKI